MATGSEFSLVSRHCDRYMSWPRVRLAVLERDGYQCRCCGARQKYIERPLYGGGFSTFITYSGRNLRPYHFANPNDRPTIAHRTGEMVTLCFDYYWHDGDENAHQGGENNHTSSGNLTLDEESFRPRRVFPLDF